MKRVILLNGLPRSGKDTCADYLVSKHGYTKLAFADAIKEILSTGLCISVEQLDTLKNENAIIHTLGRDDIQISVRELVKHFGSEGMKPKFGHDVWSRLVYEKIHSLKTHKIVVSDFRFLVEYQPQEGLELETWLIDDGRDLPTVGHASDVELYNNDFAFDKLVFNKDKVRESSLRTYHRVIDNALQGYTNEKR